MTRDLASVVVVNYNGRRYLDECLTALERQTVPRHRYEILLIDNASVDDSVPLVRSAFPGVRVVVLDRNLGFTGANNVGFRLARGRWIVLLNNDTRVEPDWLAGLLSAASDERVGGVCSRLMFRDRPELVNSTGLELYRDGRAGDRHLGRKADAEVTRPSEVFGGCGASLLLNRKLLDDVGGFDPTLFMYYEDLDLAWRGRLRGWRFVYAPNSVVAHVCGGSVSSPLLLHQTERNRTLLALSHAPVWQAVSAVVGQALRIGRALMRYGCRRPELEMTLGHLQALVTSFASMVWHAPSRLLSRYESRIARRLCSDRAINVFVRRGPRWE